MVVEIDANNENQFVGCAGLGTSESPEEWVKSCILRRDEKSCSETGTAIPSNMYFAIRQSDNKLAGIIDLRHHINYPILGIWGGHCGYSVRPSGHGRGYAKEMLWLNIENAK